MTPEERSMIDFFNTKIFPAAIFAVGVAWSVIATSMGLYWEALGILIVPAIAVWGYWEMNC